MDETSRNAKIPGIRVRAENQKGRGYYSDEDAMAAFRDRVTLLEALDAERAKLLLLGDMSPRSTNDVLCAMRRIEDDIRATMQAADRETFKDTTTLKNTGKRYTLTVEDIA